MKEFNQKQPKIDRDIDFIFKVVWIGMSVGVTLMLVAIVGSAIIGWHFLGKWW